MQLQLIMLAVAALVAPTVSHQHGFTRHFGCLKNMHKRLFESVATDLKAVDERVQSSCGRHSNQNSREIVEEGRYMVAAPLAGYSEDDFDIKIQGRAMYITAHKVSPHAHYTEVRTLPTFVNANMAVYSYDEDQLKVIFPIKNDASICNLGFTQGITTVPKFQLNAMMIRFGEDDTTTPTRR